MLFLTAYLVYARFRLLNKFFIEDVSYEKFKSRQNLRRDK